MRIKYIFRTVIILLFVTAGRTESHSAVITPNTIDSLKIALSKAHSAADSIPILYNIFDAISVSKSQIDLRKERRKYLDMLYDCALATRNWSVAFDALCNISVTRRLDVELQDSLLQRLNDSRFGVSTALLETRAFLKLQKYQAGALDSLITEQERSERLKELLDDATQSDSLSARFDRIVYNFAMVLYAGPMIPSEQLITYLTDIEKLVDTSTSRRSPLRSFYFTQAPVLLSELEYYSESINYDLTMLKILDEMEADNKRVGREFMNYDRARFSIYRRLVGNYPDLTLNQVYDYYNKALEIVPRLKDKDFEELDFWPVEGMKCMAEKDYANALKYLRNAMTSKIYTRKPRFINAYIEAARYERSFDDLENGYNIYISLLKKEAQNAIEDSYARLAIAYELDSIDNARELAETNNRKLMADVEMSAERVTIITLLCVGILLITLTAFQIVAKRRASNLAKRLEESNKELKTERDALSKAQAEITSARDKARVAERKKTEFIHNISHEISEPVKAIVGFSQIIVDSIPEEKRRYLDGFMDIVNHNSQILQRLVGDVLDSAELENVVTNVTALNFSLSNACNTIADTFRPRLNPALQLIIKDTVVVSNIPGDNDNIDTDRNRLEQILLNVIGNAVKFTEKGKIIVESEVNRLTGMGTVSVSDSGPGIPAGKEDVAFERFEKLGRYHTGLGLGLYVSKHLAILIGGDITIDTKYKGGARFVITFPTSLKNNNIKPSEE